MSYPTITGITNTPNRTDRRDTFNSDMAQTFVDMNAMATSANAWAAYFNPLAVTMQSNADTAAAAFAALGAVAWVSGTTYAVGDVVYSPINSLSYRRLTAGAGTTDPANDTTNWRGVSRDLAQVVTDISGTYTVGHDDRGGILRATAATSVTLPSAAIGNGFTFSIDAQAAGGDVTVTPDGSETINGAASLIVEDGGSASLISDGLNWISLLSPPLPAPLSSVASDIIPDADSTRDLGSASTAWALAYLDAIEPVGADTTIKRVGGTNSTPIVEGIVKSWVNFNGTGEIAPRDSLNVSSLTDNGVGRYAVNFTNAFANTNYISQGSASVSSANVNGIWTCASGVATASARNVATQNTAGANIDAEFSHGSFVGDLA